ncbi:MAG: HAD family hydrolase [Actinomycetota bacterium]
MKAVCLFDWDGTLRRGITALDWMEFLTPLVPNARRSASDMKELLEDYRSGEVNYRHLVRKAAELYAKCIAEVAVEHVTSLADQFAQEDRRSLFDFVPSLLQRLHAKEIATVVVSGAPVEVLQAYRRMLPIDRIYGLVVERRNGYFTGSIQLNHGLMGKKREVVAALLAEGYTIKLAAGNSTSDLPLLEHPERRFLISDEQEVREGVNASFVDTKHAARAFDEAI